MEALATNWTWILALLAALGVAGALIGLLKQGRMQTGDLSVIAGLMDKLGEVLKTFGRDDGVVALLARYAAKAVRVVEQMVKNGELEKDNELRKNEARKIVEQLALTDGVNPEIVYANEEAIGDLIEAAVNEMQSSGVKIEFGPGEEEVPPDEEE